jgi:serine phosphatase RsbU (regulator of sigma subunit)/DNA-binding response OmpR family regulator
LSYVGAVATVLVVDDDAPSREFMCALLNYRGHRIREAGDGDSALASVARQPPDAVITDVIMPGLDGYELARALRGEPTTRHIPIVFSTAHYGPQEIQPLVDAFDVHDVIFKPANPTTVLATIDALLVPGRASVPSADRVAETQRLTRSGTWELDAVTSTIIVSPELRDVLRLPSTELRLDELIRRVHPDDVAGITTMVENTWCTGAAGTAELRVADPEGVVHELIVSCRTTPAQPSPTAAPALWGVAQDVTRIREKVRTDLRVQADWHAVRRTIDAFHRAVLPRSLPTVAGAGLAAMYLPALERLDIGAAWYDALPLSRGRLLMSVGRVAGHDQHPAAVMGRVLAALNAYGYEDPDPAGVLVRLNRLLTDTRGDDTFVTAVVAVFDPDTGRLRVANGGNPAPLVISRDRDGDAAAALLASPGPALGILPDVVFPELDVYLAPGSAFCAYTDGLIDRNGDLGHGKHLQRVAAQAFGRLSEDHPDRPPAAQFLAENIVGGMLGGAAPDDDVCLAVLYAGA